MNCATTLTINKEAKVRLTQQNNYPWDGSLAFRINPLNSVFFNLPVRAFPDGRRTKRTFRSFILLLQRQTKRKAVIKK